ncbi:NAD(P)H-hydrate dehydratase [bacterium]|nr:NAD(P)H-hydrate dehydratase [bacterium]
MSMKGMVSRLFDRPLTAHKGDFGRVGVLAGSLSMLGAASLTAQSALRMGSGLVYVYSHEGIKEVLKDVPELLVFPVISGNSDVDLKQIQAFITEHRVGVLAIGPGLGNTGYTRELVQGVLEMVREDDIQVVVDADGLNVSNVAIFKQRPSGSLVLTPHVGEFRQLFPDFSDKIDDSIEVRKRLALEASKQCSQVVVLKGHRSVVAYDGDVYVNETGNPAMATAGMGDVLTGMIASLCGQGFTGFDAAIVGVYLHGFGADRVEKECSIGLLASDVVQCLPGMLATLRDTLD